MARIRTIKPKFFQHEALFDAEKVSGLPLRVAFAGLWTQADREGRFEWRPRSLKINILPYDEVDFPAVLSALESAGFIKRYDVDGKSLGFIPSWHEHQFLNVKEPPSTLPAPSSTTPREYLADDPDETGEPPDDDGTVTRVERVSNASTTRAERVSDGCVTSGKGKGKEGKGRDTESRLAARATPGLDLQTFERWEAYRVEIRKPLKPSSLEASATELAKYGNDQAAVVQQSIANGWQGLFPLKSNGNGVRGPPLKLRTADEIEAEERARGDFNAQH